MKESMKTKTIGLTLLLSIAAGAMCFASPNPTEGTWKLNELKSSVPGPSLAISISPTGEYHFDNGTNTYSFRCDGREYPAATNQTISCTQAIDSLINVTTKAHGKTVRTSHWELSADGRALTIKRTAIEADGSAKTSETVYSRPSASAGFAGDWLDTKRLESRLSLLIVRNETSLHLAEAGGVETLAQGFNRVDSLVGVTGRRILLPV
jgi:hypothetical protein